MPRLWPLYRGILSRAGCCLGLCRPFTHPLTAVSAARHGEYRGAILNKSLTHQEKPHRRAPPTPHRPARDRSRRPYRPASPRAVTRRWRRQDLARSCVSAQRRTTGTWAWARRTRTSSAANSIRRSSTVLPGPRGTETPKLAAVPGSNLYRHETPLDLMLPVGRDRRAYPTLAVWVLPRVINRPLIAANGRSIATLR
jgi:hypothetical protein